jgi:hypothetical protein
LAGKLVESSSAVEVVLFSREIANFFVEWSSGPLQCGASPLRVSQHDGSSSVGSSSAGRTHSIGQHAAGIAATTRQQQHCHSWVRSALHVLEH